MDLQNKRVLVTGGAGFIGSHVVDGLLALGARVTVLDNLVTGNINNLKDKPVTYEQKDILDKKAVDQIVKNNQIIFHFAANADVPMSVKNPTYDFENNIIGSFNLLKSAVDAKIEKFIFASSAAVYGNPQHVPVDELHPTNPISPYGASKLAIEHLGRTYWSTFGLPFVTMRIFNTYGERQPRYVMYDLLRKLYKNSESLEVLGTGEQLRDYSYVTDTARAFIMAAQTAEGGSIYNIAGGKTISIKDIVAMLIKELAIPHVRVTYTQKSWPGDIGVLSADISKIRNELGFAPSVPLEVGVQKLHAWLKNQE